MILGVELAYWQETAIKLAVILAVVPTASLVLVYLPGMDRVYPALFNAHAEVVYNVALELLSEDQFEEWVRAEEMIGPKA